MIKIVTLIIFLVFSKIAYSEVDIDQWQDSEKTYKDLIDEGFEVKAYDTTTINTKSGIIILLFVTVLQKNNIIFECQEYQTLDDTMTTLDMALICRKLSQPYNRGVGI